VQLKALIIRVEVMMKCNMDLIPGLHRGRVQQIHIFFFPAVMLVKLEHDDRKTQHINKQS